MSPSSSPETDRFRFSFAYFLSSFKNLGLILWFTPSSLPLDGSPSSDENPCVNHNLRLIADPVFIPPVATPPDTDWVGKNGVVGVVFWS